jgi:hypothetical protein
MSTLEEDDGITLRNIGDQLSSDAVSYPGTTRTTIPLVKPEKLAVQKLPDVDCDTSMNTIVQNLR